MARRTRLGARCVVFNNRGRGGHTLKTPRTYCASKTDDLAAVIDHIKTKNPSASLMALGVSLGKYFALNKVTEVQEENKLKNKGLNPQALKLSPFMVLPLESKIEADGAFFPHAF